MNFSGKPHTKLSTVLYSTSLLGLMCLLVWYSNKALNSPMAENNTTHRNAAEHDVINIINQGQSEHANTKETSITQQAIFATPKTLINDLGANTLLGTEIDGVVRTDANGNLIVDQALRDYFDYFLSASDEIGPEMAIQAALELIDQSLPSAAAKQARGVFQRYLRYLSEQYKIGDQPLISDVNNDVDALRVLRQTTSALRKVRERLFTEQESQALFGLEDANADFTLKSLELFADDSLSLEQQRTELERLQSELPQSLQASIDTSAQQKLEQQQVQAILQQQELDDAQLYTQLRSLNLSVEHTQELIVYRQNQAYFEQQYQRYTAAKVQLGDAASNTNLLQDFFPTPEAQTAARLRDLNSN